MTRFLLYPRHLAAEYSSLDYAPPSAIQSRRPDPTDSGTRAEAIQWYPDAEL